MRPEARKQRPAPSPSHLESPARPSPASLQCAPEQNPTNAIAVTDPEVPEDDTNTTNHDNDSLLLSPSLHSPSVDTEVKVIIPKDETVSSPRSKLHAILEKQSKEEDNESTTQHTAQSAISSLSPTASPTNASEEQQRAIPTQHSTTSPTGCFTACSFASAQPTQPPSPAAATTRMLQNESEFTSYNTSSEVNEELQEEEEEEEVPEIFHFRANEAAAVALFAEEEQNREEISKGGFKAVRREVLHLTLAAYGATAEETVERRNQCGVVGCASTPALRVRSVSPNPTARRHQSSPSPLPRARREASLGDVPKADIPERGREPTRKSTKRLVVYDPKVEGLRVSKPIPKRSKKRVSHRWLLQSLGLKVPRGMCKTRRIGDQSEGEEDVEVFDEVEMDCESPRFEGDEGGGDGDGDEGEGDDSC